MDDERTSEIRGIRINRQARIWHIYGNRLSSLALLIMDGGYGYALISDSSYMSHAALYQYGALLLELAEIMPHFEASFTEVDNEA